ncbi:MAG TPA: CBS domain-containing protein, partial [Gemmatimonadales bacterium]|nr:CBS domain-containing protein [Gemmatimonadales bacterium]
MIWTVVLLGLLLTIFGATAAAALITSSRSRLAEVVARRLRGGKDSLAWLAPLERDLAAASVTTTLGIAMLGAVFPGLFAGATLPRLILLLVLFAVPSVLLSGYFLPRFLTYRRAAKVADRFRPILRPWAAVLAAILPSPRVRPESLITEMWRERARSGAAPDDELLRVGGVINFSQRSVRSVMTPRTELVAIPEEAQVEEVRAAFVQSGYSRLPVYRGTLDELVGMVHAFDLFRLAPGDPLPVRPLGVAPASRSCGDALLDMQRERRHLAIVLDEFGGTLGIVTLEDLLQAMVGEIVDEDEPVSAFAAAPSPDLVELEGAVPLSDLEARFGVTLPEGQATTL